MDNSEIPPCCACGEAKYTLNFKGIWSKFTHPKDWPENGINKLTIIWTIDTIKFNCKIISAEWLTHWSNIIGATHSKNYSVWEYGGYATPGIKELAEYGVVSTLEEELKNHVSWNFCNSVNVNLREIHFANKTVLVKYDSNCSNYETCRPNKLYTFTK